MAEKIRVDIEQVDEELVRRSAEALAGEERADREIAAPYRANGAKHGGVVAPK